jgi:hypothetical protein
MQSVSNDNFGPLIAYLVPGMTVLAGVSPFSPTFQGWFATASAAAPSLGGFLYVTVASLARVPPRFLRFYALRVSGRFRTH